jgi:hypothetical protein
VGVHVTAELQYSLAQVMRLAEIVDLVDETHLPIAPALSLLAALRPQTLRRTFLGTSDLRSIVDGDIIHPKGRATIGSENVP